METQQPTGTNVANCQLLCVYLYGDACMYTTVTVLYIEGRVNIMPISLVFQRSLASMFHSQAAACIYAPSIEITRCKTRERVNHTSVQL